MMSLGIENLKCVMIEHIFKLGSRIPVAIQWTANQELALIQNS